MNNTKKTGFRRLISFVLALAVLLGALPLTALPVSAAESQSWNHIYKNDQRGEPWEVLRRWLRESGVKYIRLDCDIVLDEGENTPFWSGDSDQDKKGMLIVGEKHLDLNGHKIVYRNDKYQNTDKRKKDTALFRVTENASFTLYDTGKKGYITYEGPVNRYGGPERNVFWIDDGGKMTVNGGEIEAGRSKSVYLGKGSYLFADTSSSLSVNSIGHLPAGTYVRDQAPGCAVIVATGGELTVNRGSLSGRARLNVSDDYAAVYMQADSTVTINDAWLRGNGGASCVIVEQDEVDPLPKARLTVRSGVFDLKTPDYLRFGQANSGYGYDLWTVIKGPYGHIIMGRYHNRYNTIDRYSASDDNFAAADFLEGGGYTEGTYRTKIDKVEQKKNANLGNKIDAFSYTDKEWTFYSRPDNEPNTRVKFTKTPVVTWFKNSHEKITMDEYASYYPKSGMDELNKYRDYLQEDTNRYGAQIIAVAQIFDSKGNAVSADYTTQIDNPSAANLEWDLYNFEAKDGTKINYSIGKRYTLRVTVYEYWNGQHNWTVENCAEHNFIPVDTDIERSLAFSIRATEYGTSSNGNTSIQVKPSYSSLALSNLSGVVYSYGYVDYELNEAGAISTVKVFKQLQTSNAATVLEGLPTGAQTVIGRISGVESAAGNLYHEVFAEKNVFIMPRIQAKKNGETAYKTYTDNTVRTETNGSVTLQAFDESALKYSQYHPEKPNQYVYDVLNRHTLSMSDVKWEMWDATEREYKRINSSFSGITVSDGRLITDRSGVYRAVILYDSSEWHSPQPITVIGKNYDSTEKTVTVTASAESMEWNDRDLTVTVKLNRNEANWGNRNIRLEVLAYKDDVPAQAWEKQMSKMTSSGNVLAFTSKNLSSSAADDTYTFSLNEVLFGKNGFKEETVPGIYRFYAKATISTIGNSYVISALPVTVEVEKRATNIDVIVDGQDLTEGRAASYTPNYIMPANTNTVKVSARRYPADSTLPGSLGTVYTSSNPSVVKVDANGNLTALAPGNATVTLRSSGKVGSGDNAQTLEYTASFTVTVPIAGFKLGEAPDWQQAVSQNKTYENVTIAVTHVKAYNGEWIENTGNKYITAKCVSADGHRPHPAGGSVTIGSFDKVQYNDYNVVADFKVQVNAGYRFPTQVHYGSELCVDMHNVRANLPGIEKETTLVLNNYWYDAVKDVFKQGTSGASITDAAVRFTMNVPIIKDPDAVYLKTVALSSEEPKEGDARYQGDLDSVDVDSLGVYDGNMMNVNVYTLEGEKVGNDPDRPYMEGKPVVGVNFSNVFKPSTVKGSGNNYGMVDNAEDISGINIGESSKIYYNAGGKVTKASILSHRYTPGTYVHNIRLYAGLTNGADGKKYYFDPDVQVLVNGRPITLNHMTSGMGGVVSEVSGYGANELNLYYYYVADESPAYNKATVTGLVAPATGATPQSAEDLGVTDVTRHGSEEYVTYHDLYVSRLEWFVDKNGNDVIDAGESCEDIANGLLAENGTFLPEKAYSVWIEIASENGRLDNTSFALRLDGVPTPISTESSKASYEFDPTEPPPGVTVSGTVTSFNSETDAVTVQLIQAGASEASYDDVVYGNSQNYSIGGVLPGTYTVRVMKSKHVTREYTVTVGNADVTLDVKIHLPGDVTGDGRVNTTDINRIKAHIRQTKPITDEYLLKCANVAGSGSTINVTDVNRIKAHIRQTKPLF